MTSDPKQTKKWVQIIDDPQLDCELKTIPSSLLTDDEISTIWEILGRIADDSDNPIYPSEDAEICIGYYE
jgi:hypothetical protein|tara:strand:+ start:626 stop:835 length:210 start_codon:yes stop_codon:yes gene_type:complete